MCIRIRIPLQTRIRIRIHIGVCVHACVQISICEQRFVFLCRSTNAHTQFHTPHLYLDQGADTWGGGLGGGLRATKGIAVYLVVGVTGYRMSAHMQHGGFESGLVLQTCQIDPPPTLQSPLC